jgi:hypothetical protein
MISSHMLSVFNILYMLVEWKSKKVKDKSVPLNPLTSHEGSRRLRLPEIKTIGT